jgi:hypothetical protein
VNQAILDIHSPEQIVVDIIKIDENHEVNDQEIEVEMGVTRFPLLRRP